MAVRDPHGSTAASISRRLQSVESLDASPSASTLLEENARLREQIAAYERSAALMDRVAVENALLASAVMQFKQDVAQQAIKYRLSDSLRLSAMPSSASGNATQPSSVAASRVATSREGTFSIYTFNENMG